MINTISGRNSYNNPDYLSSFKGWQVSKTPKYPNNQNNVQEQKYPHISQKYYQSNFALQAKHNLSNISFLGDTAKNINKVISLNENGESSLIRRPDGGYLVDKDTGTVVYYGLDAKNFLKNTAYFDKDTEIVSQSDGQLSVTAPARQTNSERKSLSFSEPGAILIEKNIPG